METIFLRAGPILLGPQERACLWLRILPINGPRTEIKVTIDNRSNGWVPSSSRRSGCFCSAKIPWMVGEQEGKLGKWFSFPQCYSLPGETKGGIISLWMWNGISNPCLSSYHTFRRKIPMETPWQNPLKLKMFSFYNLKSHVYVCADGKACICTWGNMNLDMMAVTYPTAKWMEATKCPPTNK